MSFLDGPEGVDAHSLFLGLVFDKPYVVAKKKKNHLSCNANNERICQLQGFICHNAVLKSRNH